MNMSLTMFFGIMLGIGIFIAILSSVADDILDSLGLDTLGLAMFFAGFGGVGLVLQLIIDNRILLLLLSTLAGLICYIVVYFFIAPKLRNDVSIASSIQDFKGKKGTVIIDIPKEGYGKVRIENGIYFDTRPATSYENKEIEQGKEIVVMDVINGVLHVSEVVKEEF